MSTVYPPPGSSGDGVSPGGVIQADLVVNPGASATGFTVRIRKGSLTGTILGTTVSAVGTAGQIIRVFGVDLAPVGAYVLTLQQAGASGAGTVSGYLSIEV
jgi:hypothetical protein